VNRDSDRDGKVGESRWMDGWMDGWMSRILILILSERWVKSTSGRNLPMSVLSGRTLIHRGYLQLETRFQMRNESIEVG
jgi:hypothetical protein